MAAISQITYQVKPGRMEDFLAAARELKGAIERLGVNVRAVRLFEAEVAGPHSGRVVLSFEYADLASWGATVDREHAAVVDRALLVERPL
jgi:hypothetical protein